LEKEGRGEVGQKALDDFRGAAENRPATQAILPADCELTIGSGPCESAGKDVNTLDSNATTSYGILQIQLATWDGW
jgi:hypothetical protein